MFSTFKLDFFKKEELTECPVEDLECELLVFQFTAKSSLGWIAWKEREASLFRLFERIFNAQSCFLTFTSKYNEFVLGFSAPANQIERVSNYLRQGQLGLEIDKIHGVLKDVVLSKLESITGKNLEGKSSLQSIEDRVLVLTAVDYQRKREIVALSTQFDFLKDKAQGALDAFKEDYDKKLYEKCISKFENIEKRILEIVDEDLKVLRADINESS